MSTTGRCAYQPQCPAAQAAPAPPAHSLINHGLSPLRTPQANPHKRLRQLYGPRMMAQYRGVPLGELSPHVYAIAEQARSAVPLWRLQLHFITGGMGTCSRLLPLITTLTVDVSVMGIQQPC